MRCVSDDFLGAATIRGEAEGETYRGKVMVGEVIRARVASPSFSVGTAGSTVLRPGQFDCWANSRLRMKLLLQDDADPLYLECLSAWLDSIGTTYAQGALYYLNPETVMRLYGKLPSWATPASEVAREDHHVFYLPLPPGGSIVARA